MTQSSYANYLKIGFDRSLRCKDAEAQLQVRCSCLWRHNPTAAATSAHCSELCVRRANVIWHRVFANFFRLLC